MTFIFQHFKRNYLIIIICLFVFILAYIFGLKINSRYSKEAISKQIIFNTNKQIVLVYFGCSTCAAANNPDLIKYYSKIKESIQRRVVEKEINFTTIGISNDYLIQDGLNHLEKFDNFNEVAIGNGMSNSGIHKYIWHAEDIIPQAATPQIQVLFRTYKSTGIGGHYSVLSEIEKDSMLINEVGVSGFKKLSENLFFLDTL
jgi:hypothetical protein